jgi:aspartate aminotransferase
VIVGCGGKHVLYLAFQAILDPGDAVLLPAPYWVSYVDMTRLAGGVPVILPCTAADDLKLTPARLEAALADYPYAKILVLNSPSNPTGVMYNEAELRALAAVVARHPGLTVLSDEIYEHLVYDGQRQFSIAQVEEANGQTVIINGCSKAYSMTGWRIGWAIGDAGLIDAMTRIASHETSNPTSIAQAAAETALRGDQGCVEEMRRAFEGRKRVMIDGLRALPGVTCNEPGGAFYAFPDVSAHFRPGETADQFSERLLEKAKVAVVPGNGFGAPHHVRLSYATSLGDIEAGLARLGDFLADGG